MDTRTDEYSCIDAKENTSLQESNEDYAAAGTSEDQSALAKNGARQGLIQHLRREGLQCKNENIILKKLVENLEIEKIFNLKQLEMCRDEVKHVSGSLVWHQQELDKLKAVVKSMDEENMQLKQKIGECGNGFPNKLLTEIQDLRDKLLNTENEGKGFAEQLEESQKQLLLSDNELKTLELKCKQYEFQIQTLQDRRHLEDWDDVDGHVIVLSKCLEMIKLQKREVAVLKEYTLADREYLEQVGFLAGHTKTMKCTKSREEAIGSSVQQKFEQLCALSTYLDTQERYSGNQLNKTTVDVINKDIDYGDKRTFETSGVDTHMVGITKSVLGITIANANARNFKTPSKNFNDTKSVFALPSTSAQLKPSCRPITDNNGVDYENQISRNPVRYETSPKKTIDENESLRDDNITLPHVHSSNVTYQKNVSKPRLPSDYINLQCEDSRPLRILSRTCNRMAHSEIIFGPETRLKNLAMSHEVLLPKQICTNKLNEMIGTETCGKDKRPNNVKHPYINVVNEENNGRDNVNVDVKSRKNIEQTTEENKETRQLITAHSKIPNLLKTQNIREDSSKSDLSALKICPVCNLEFSRLSMTDFQRHVCECFEHYEESPETQQVHSNEEDSVCPLCQAAFPATVSQEIYEKHVLAHFGDEPV